MGRKAVRLDDLPMSGVEERLKNLRNEIGDFVLLVNRQRGPFYKQMKGVHYGRDYISCNKSQEKELIEDGTISEIVKV